MVLSIALLLFVTLQRLAELIHACRNTRRLLARGALEIGAAHYPLMIVLHASWLGGLWLMAVGQPISFFWFVVFMALQLLRVWVLATLKDRWTTRIIVLPGAAWITSGPYRFLRHPNYVIVIGEIAALPLAFGLPVFAVVFSLLNAIVLTIRIRAENRALCTAII